MEMEFYSVPPRGRWSSSVHRLRKLSNSDQTGSQKVYDAPARPAILGIMVDQCILRCHFGPFVTRNVWMRHIYSEVSAWVDTFVRACCCRMCGDGTTVSELNAEMMKSG
jgi:hypothetical protein